MITGYETAVSGVATPGSGAPAIEFESNGTRIPRVREWGVASQAATAYRFQLGRPGNTPTAGTLAPGAAQGGFDPASTAGTTITWTTSPTAPAASSVLRQWDFNNVPGSGVIWTWPADGEVLVGLVAGAANSRAGSLIIWGLTAGPTCDFYVVWSE